MNSQSVYQPGGKSLDAFYAGVLYKRSYCQRLVSGILQLITGFLIVLTECVLLYQRYTTSSVASGLWCGPFIIASGTYGIRAHVTQNSKTKLNSYIMGVLAICPFSILTILIGSLALYLDLMEKRINYGLIVNGLKVFEGALSIVFSCFVISRIGRKGDTKLISDYRRRLADKTHEAAQVISLSLRRERKLNVGTVTSRNSTDSLCDKKRFPPIFTTNTDNNHGGTDYLDLELFSENDSISETSTQRPIGPTQPDVSTHI